MIGYVLPLLMHVKIDLTSLRSPSKPALVSTTHTTSDFFHSPLYKQVGDVLALWTFAHGIERLAPFVLRAPGSTDAIKPGVNRPIVVLYAMVARRDELVILMIRHLIDACSAAN